MVGSCLQQVFGKGLNIGQACFDNHSHYFEVDLLIFMYGNVSEPDHGLHLAGCFGIQELCVSEHVEGFSAVLGDAQFSHPHHVHCSIYGGLA